ncbi:MAG: M15 family metallopeptidase [Lachnospiraceae bacterium]|nr:M15 family metallopeptidase [Lachnospiraceae bacterium]
MEKKRSETIWRLIAIFAICLCALFGVLYGREKSAGRSSEVEQSTTSSVVENESVSTETVSEETQTSKVQETTTEEETETETESETEPETVSEITAVKKDQKTITEDTSDFVLLTDYVPDAILEIRYYSTYNFVGERIDGYEEPIAIVTKETALALAEVSEELEGLGYRLKIYDAYRPQTAVTHFVNWAKDLQDTSMKEYFYPEVRKSELFSRGYIAKRSGHSRGSTVDLTLFDMTTEKEVDMGGTFDYFGELSHPDYMGITKEQYANRMLLRSVMMNHGFKPIAQEWWHFTLKDEPYPNTYFSFPVNSDSLESAEMDDAA